MAPRIQSNSLLGYIPSCMIGVIHRIMPAAAIILVTVLIASCSSVAPSAKSTAGNKLKRGDGVQKELKSSRESIDSSLLNPLQRSLLRVAFANIGKQYCYGGLGPDCFDCSGFVGQVYSSVGVKLPRKASDLAESKLFEKVDGDDAKPGDIVLFDLAGRGYVDHVGILLTDFRMIHSSTSRGVVIDDIQKPPFLSGLNGFRALIGK